MYLYSPAHPFHQQACSSYILAFDIWITLQWLHNGRDHQLHDCLLNRLFRRISKKTSNLRVTGLCAGNSPVTAEFPAQRAGNVENRSIWWRHHALFQCPVVHRMVHVVRLWNRDKMANILLTEVSDSFSCVKFVYTYKKYRHWRFIISHYFPLFPISYSPPLCDLFNSLFVQCNWV